MTISSEVYIVLGALLGIAAACITPGLIFSMSDDMLEENEKKRKDHKNEQIITVKPNEVNENVSVTGQSNPIIVTNEPNNNATNTKQSITSKNKPPIIAYDPNNNVIPVKRSDKIYGESTIQSVLNGMEEEIPKLLKPVVIRIDVNNENSEKEESSQYDDALSNITNHNNTDVDIILHPSPKVNDNDEDTEYLNLSKEIAVSCSQKNELKEKHGSFRKKMLISDHSNIQDNKVRLSRASTFLHSKYKKIKKVIPVHEETIEFLNKLGNDCDCESCKPSTENNVFISKDSNNYIHNITNDQISTKIPGIKYPIDVSVKSDEFEVIELLGSNDKSNENIEISNGMRVSLIPSKTPMQKFIRKIRNVFLFKKSLHQKTSLSPVKAKDNGCKAHSF